jgi:hypothetical protein
MCAGLAFSVSKPTGGRLWQKGFLAVVFGNIAIIFSLLRGAFSSLAELK